MGFLMGNTLLLRQLAPHLIGIELQALEIHSQIIHSNQGKERFNWSA